VQRLLLAMGIISKIFQNRRLEGYRVLPDGRGGEKEYFCKTFHELIIAQSDIVKFQQVVGFVDPSKKAKLAKLISEYTRGPYCKKYETIIKTIGIKYITDVYDCTIPVGHAFTAAGVVSHNCGESFLK